MRFVDVMTLTGEIDPPLTPLVPEWDGEPDEQCYLHFLEQHFRPFEVR